MNLWLHNDWLPWLPWERWQNQVETTTTLFHETNSWLSKGISSNSKPLSHQFFISTSWYPYPSIHNAGSVVEHDQFFSLRTLQFKKMPINKVLLKETLTSHNLTYEIQFGNLTCSLCACLARHFNLSFFFCARMAVHIRYWHLKLVWLWLSAILSFKSDFNDCIWWIFGHGVENASNSLAKKHTSRCWDIISHFAFEYVFYLYHSGHVNEFVASCEADLMVEFFILTFCSLHRFPCVWLTNWRLNGCFFPVTLYREEEK